MAIQSLTVKQIISRVRQVFPNAPETYMDKLAVSGKVPFEATDLDFSLEKNIQNILKY